MALGHEAFSPLCLHYYSLTSINWRVALGNVTSLRCWKHLIGLSFSHFYLGRKHHCEFKALIFERDLCMNLNSPWHSSLVHLDEIMIFVSNDWLLSLEFVLWLLGGLAIHVLGTLPIGTQAIRKAFWHYQVKRWDSWASQLDQHIAHVPKHSLH